MSAQEESKELNKSDFQLFMTVTAIIVSLLTLVFTCNRMDKQVDEMKRNTELQWRPLLDIKIRDSSLYFLAYSKNNSDTIIYDVNKVAFNSPLYDSIKYIQMFAQMGITRYNVGKYPLWIKQQFFHVSTSALWVDTLHKSPELFINYLHRYLHASGDPRFETDVMIRANDSSLLKDRAVNFAIEKSLVEKYRDSLQKIIVYPFSYIEYQDIFGNEYNTLLIQSLTIELHKNNYYLQYYVQPQSKIEVYRFDSK